MSLYVTSILLCDHVGADHVWTAEMKPIATLESLYLQGNTHDHTYTYIHTYIHVMMMTE
jgi:hypothetical protein